MFGQLPLSKSLSIAFCACLALWVFYLSPFDPGSGLTSFHSDKEASTIFRHDFVPCNDAHGQLITPDLKTAGDERTFDYAPQPYAGSYTALKLPHTWTTASERYRQYGFNRSSNEPLRWDHVDWAQLQKDCLLRNLAYGADRDAVPLISAARRMSLPRLNNHAMPEALRLRPSRPKTTTGRTAIVIRGYSSFKFKEEDFWNLRSLITETSLSYGGKYSVYLLVDVKGDADVFHNAAEYERVLKESVPAEFRNMTVLIDQKNLLAGWYSKIGEHR